MRPDAALFLLLALPAAATPLLDQETLPSGGIINVDNDVDASQQFTVATNGSIVRIDVFAVDDFGTCGDVGCSLRLGASAFPRSVVATDLVSPRTVGDWLEFTLATPLAVSAGGNLFFDVDHDNFIVWGAGTHTPGAEWRCVTDGCTHPLNPNPFDYPTDVPEGTSFSLTESYAFRVWVESAALPEPAGLTGAAAVVAGLAASRRRLRE